MIKMFKDATNEEIDDAMKEAWHAFHQYRKMPLKKRADFMCAIGEELKKNENELVQTAMKETNLPEARLKGELARTIFQLINMLMQLKVANGLKPG
jgi:NADP-dependent aldehyde dehydrogenase